jgi:hypothetical protein
MKIKLIISLLAAAIVAGGILTTKSLAADNAAAKSPRANILQRIADKLNLTADQRTQIKAVIAGEKDTLVPLLSLYRS